MRKPSPAVMRRIPARRRPCRIRAAVPNTTNWSTPGCSCSCWDKPTSRCRGYAVAAVIDCPGAQALAGNHFGGGALHQQLAVGQVSQLVAAFGLVHVMGADQHADAFGRQPVQLFPEIAARGRIDAGGRFVQQQQFRLVQHAGRQREPLLPAAERKPASCLARLPFSFPGSARPLPCGSSFRRCGRQNPGSRGC